MKVRAINVDSAGEINVIDKPTKPVEPVINPVEPVEPTKLVEPTKPVEIIEPITPIEPVITDELLGEYLKEKHGIDSIQELLDKKKEADEPQIILPTNVKSFLKWREDNDGGTMSEYITVTKDWNNVTDDEVIDAYMKIHKKHLSTEEIAFETDRMFSFDDTLDSESDVMAKQIAKKDYLKQAREYFEKSSSEFTPSRLDEKEIPTEYKDALLKYKEVLKTQGDQQVFNDKQRSLFKSETDKYFSEEFKGFEFKIEEDKSAFYKPTNIDVLKDSNLELSNMLGKYVNEDGSVKSISEYHRAISIASDPEAFAKFFFEQGKSEGVEEVINTGSNRTLKPRTSLSTDGTKAKVRKVSVGGSDYQFKLKNK